MAFDDSTCKMDSGCEPCVDPAENGKEPCRPPFLSIPSHEIRHDINSDDMRRVHFDLPDTPQGRMEHVLRCDKKAYDSIKTRYPRFTPPGDKMIRGEKK